MDKDQEADVEQYKKESLGELLDAVIKEDKSAGFVKGYPDKFFVLPGEFWKKTKEPDGKTRKQTVIDEYYTFANRFEGHEADVSQTKDKYENPLDYPLQDYLDYFASAQKALDDCDTEFDNTKRYQIFKRNSLNEIRQSIGEDTERVAEALLHAIAEKVAENNPKVARLLGKLEGNLAAEGMAEENETEEVGNYVRKVSQPTTMAAAITDYTDAIDDQEWAEMQRVETTRKLCEALSPVLKDTGLFDPINDWYEFSNPETEESESGE